MVSTHFASLCFLAILYSGASLILAYLSKHVHYLAPFPVLMSWIHVSVTAIVCWVLGRVNWPSALSNTFAALPECPKQSYKWSVGKQVLSFSCIFTIMILTGSLCMISSPRVYYGAATTLTLGFNLVLSFFLLESVSVRATGALLVLMLGYMLQSGTEFAAGGLVLGLVYSFFMALTSVCVTRFLPFVEKNPWNLTYYTCCNASAMLLPLLLHELYRVDWNPLHSASFWMWLILAGFFSFCVTITMFAVIYLSSPVSFSVVQVLKSCLQSGPLHGAISSLVGLVLVTAGSSAFCWVRIAEERERESCERAARLAECEDLERHLSLAANAREIKDDISSPPLAPLSDREYEVQFTRWQEQQREDEAVTTDPTNSEATKQTEA